MASKNHNNYRLALVQMAMEIDPEENIRAAVDRICEASRLGARLVCLPELFRSQYFCRVEHAELFDLAEPIPGPSTDRLAEVARTENVTIVASIFERRAAGLYHNTAVVIGPDGAIGGVYRKMHIPDDPLFYEKYYFTPGDLGFQAFDTPVGRVGTLICWDQWYPEAARITALRGAEVLLFPTAIGWHPAEKAEFGEAQRSAWETVQRAHAIANGVFVAAVNRVGLEDGPVVIADLQNDRVRNSEIDNLGNPENLSKNPGPSGAIEFWGGSFVADPFGRILAKASDDKEEIVIADIDLSLIEETRRNWPFLRDRRIDAYAPITERYWE